MAAAVVRLDLRREESSPPLAELEICEPMLGLKLLARLLLDYVSRPYLEAGSSVKTGANDLSSK